ncbi:hypothetical protein PMAYCL1PPCAC_12529 [Pristionchus mayeri]|uniref:Uncharacterized protein n=1 Tax=Pristionchus mayeri TaxID=1317129 RepID=A0AAN5CG42_9BILA|nr:hypothetical protein PMAYCL1PPCAC_12529 [Pristionchus mayeri]
MEIQYDLPTSNESVEKALSVTQEFSDKYFKKLEERTIRFHVRMASQVNIIESQRKLVELLRKVKRQRERNEEDKMTSSAKSPKSPNVTTAKSKSPREFYGSFELKCTVDDVLKDLDALKNFGQTRKYLPEVKIPQIYDHFTTVMNKLEMGLREMNIPDSEVAGNIDSPSDFSTDLSGHSQKRR